MRAITLFFLAWLMACPAIAAQINLTWDANTDAPDGYRLYQRAEGELHSYETPIYDGQATEHSFTAAPGESGYIIARAYKDAAESGDSNEVFYRVPLTAPSGLQINIDINISAE